MSPTPRRLPDVYRVLGASRTDSWQELRRRYRARARELHPDVQVHRQTHQRLEEEHANRLFSQLQAAWALIDTPERRAAYDREHPQVAPVVPPRPRPRRVPKWASGPPVAVLLRAGPGDLHIAVPGGDWDLSLHDYARQVERGGAPPLLVGDVPPHPEVRAALRGIRFVERSRLAAMVGLPEHLEDRGLGHVDDDGVWKLDEVRTCLATAARTVPSFQRQLPYADDLLLMGRLSLAGYELNLPHPAGLTAATEPRPRTRAESAERRGHRLVGVVIPSPSLLVAANWSDDEDLRAAIAAGFLNLEGGQWLRTLAGRRPRPDHRDTLSGSVLDGPPPAQLEPLSDFRRTWEWLHDRPAPTQLPWGDPLSECGRDRRVSDAGARLVTQVLSRVLGELGAQGHLADLRGGTLRFRSEPELAAGLGGQVEVLARAALLEVLGFQVPVASL